MVQREGFRCKGMFRIMCMFVMILAIPLDMIFLVMVMAVLLMLPRMVRMLKGYCMQMLHSSVDCTGLALTLGALLRMPNMRCHQLLRSPRLCQCIGIEVI
jgi:hypothetical protein